jgi:hypothetical protein
MVVSLGEIKANIIAGDIQKPMLKVIQAMGYDERLLSPAAGHFSNR